MSSIKRRLRRFYTESIPDPGDRVLLNPSESYHLKTVLRLKSGDRCLLMDGKGALAEAEIRGFSKSGETELQVNSVSKAAESGGLFLRVIFAMAPKGKMDFLVEKSQELGVREFWPMETEYSQMSLDQKQGEKIMSRWKKKVFEAAKQSGSLSHLQIAKIRPFNETLTAFPDNEETVLFHPDSKAVPFKMWVGDLTERVKNSKDFRINLIFGPEGGFSDSEIREYDKRKSGDHFKKVYLGKNILRLETAFLGVVSALKLLFDE